MGRRSRMFAVSLFGAVVLLALGVAIGGRSLSAQDASPTSMTGMGDETPHPAHIHSGTCATLGDVVFPLTDVAAPDMMASPMAGMDMGTMATPMAGMENMGKVVAESVTIVHADLATIQGAEHAINVHESAENIGNYIACGDITGTATDNSLQITLNELNGSGYQGMAMLKDNGDGTTTVTVWLMHTSGAMGTPAASPTT